LPAETVNVAEFDELVKDAKWDEAAAWVNDALNVSPDSASSLSTVASLLGSMLMQKKRFPEATELAQRSLAAVAAADVSLRPSRGP